MEQPEAPAKEEKIKPKHYGVLFTILGLMSVGILIVVRYYTGHVITDDAQIDGYIVPVLSRLSTKIDQVNIQEGDAVTKGDTLAVLDSTIWYWELREATAALAVSRKNVALAQAETRATEDAFKEAVNSMVEAKAKLDKARKDRNRYRALYKDGAVSKSELENYELIYSEAFAGYQVSKEKTASAEIEVEASAKREEVARATVKEAYAKLREAKETLSWCIIKAPVSGEIQNMRLRAEEVVVAGQSLFDVVDSESRWVTANFKETQVRFLTPGTPVRVKVDAYPHLKLTGTVESLGGAVSSKFTLIPPSNATGNFVKVVQRVPVRIFFDKGINIRLLRQGMNVTVIHKKKDRDGK
ncbi:secretion protein HlyD [Fulvitalea axinellae]|uniref:Secretion protein HlyD n=1 Tax=Fulvitalea axinellae TaxID=1182444 RepID=A0AAU9D9M3_9BACT|nr:secretion protein HlyD [Fulvitalea axinellae]